MDSTNYLNTAPSSESSFTSNDSDDILLSMRFNQDGGCLSVGTAKGFRIYNVWPFQETCRRTFSTTQPRNSESDLSYSMENDEIDSRGGGGIGAIEMLFRCNLYALVGGGAYPRYPPNRCIIWDDHCGRDAGYLIFRQRVLTVRLRRDRICVALRDKVYVYNFSNLGEVLDTIITGGEKNGAGLLSISTEVLDSSSNFSSDMEDDGMVLACPSVKRGQVCVKLYGYRKTILIDAHETPLAAIALTADGSLLATASERGTIIRLFDTGKNRYYNESSLSPSVTPLREFRRGVEQAKIGCLCFSLDKCWLGCASDRGTVHIFRVKAGQEKNTKGRQGDSRRGENRNGDPPPMSTASKLVRSIFSPKKYLLEGENSFAKVRGISHPEACAFIPQQPNSIVVAGMDDYGNGCLLLARFGPIEEGEEVGQDSIGQAVPFKKGHIHRVGYHRFFKKGTSNSKGCEDSKILLGEESDGALCYLDDKIVQAAGDDDMDGFVNVKTDQDEKTVDETSSTSIENEIDQRELNHNQNDSK